MSIEDKSEIWDLEHPKLKNLNQFLGLFNEEIHLFLAYSQK